MLPTTLTTDIPESERRRYKVVRLDTHQDVPGLIMSASVTTGLCVMRNDPSGEAKEYNFGTHGLRIIARLRGDGRAGRVR